VSCSIPFRLPCRTCVVEFVLSRNLNAMTLLHFDPCVDATSSVVHDICLLPVTLHRRVSQPRAMTIFDLRLPLCMRQTHRYKNEVYRYCNHVQHYREAEKPASSISPLPKTPFTIWQWGKVTGNAINAPRAMHHEIPTRKASTKTLERIAQRRKEAFLQMVNLVRQNLVATASSLIGRDVLLLLLILLKS
jgi:hypothetical protein